MDIGIESMDAAYAALREHMSQLAAYIVKLEAVATAAAAVLPDLPVGCWHKGISGGPRRAGC